MDFFRGELMNVCQLLQNLQGQAGMEVGDRVRLAWR